MPGTALNTIIWACIFCALWLAGTFASAMIMLTLAADLTQPLI
jgi:hypothetical protein